MRAVESLEICTLMGLFCPNHIKSYVSWHWRMIQSLKKNWLLVPKMDMSNLVNFNASSGKSENLHFDVLLLSIAYKVSAKKYRWIISHDTKRDPSFEEKVSFCLKNDMRNLENFNPSSGKSKILHFVGLVLWEVCNIWAEKIQRICFVKNNLWFQKWHR